MTICSAPLQNTAKHAPLPLANEQSRLQNLSVNQQQTISKSTPSSNTMRQPSSVRLLPAIGVGILAAACQFASNALIWRSENTLSPYAQNNVQVPHANMDKDYIRVLCTDEGYDIKSDWNTGHCMIGVTNVSQDGWLVFDTSTDDDFLTSGSMDFEHFDWHEFSEGVYRTLPVNPDQVQQFFDSVDEFEAAGDHAWSLVENCSSFSKTIWSKDTGEDITCSTARLYTPQLLSEQLIRLNAKPA